MGPQLLQSWYLFFTPLLPWPIYALKVVEKFNLYDLQTFLPSQLRPKRCAAHCYIAQNIHYHQQITRLNPFWPSAAGPTPLYASKQYNLNTAPPLPVPDSAILGSPLQGSFAGKSLGSVQEKGLNASAGHSILAAKDKSNAAAQFMEVTQRKPPSLPQSSQPGSAGNMLAPTFIFPINQQQAAVAGAAAAAANRSGVAKLTPGSGNPAQSSSCAGYTAVAASGANGSGTSMNFNYPSLPNEAQYLAFLQNNAYPFPIPPHVGGAQPYRGANPPQAMPFFNLSFYHPSQMLHHPSQLRLQQQPPPYSQQGHQNPSTSSGSSSSQKNNQQSQRVPTAAASAITAANSHAFPSSKQQQQQHISHSHQVRQLEPEAGCEDAPSTADSRVSQAQKNNNNNIYSQKFALPTHSQNFALIAPAAAAANHSEKQQQSQAFAMSFASFGGATAASAAAGGAAPHGLDFSSMAHNHAIFHSLPDSARHGYQVSAAAAAHSTQQHQQQNKKAEDGKSPTDLGNSSAIGEEGKISSSNKVLGNNAHQHSLTFSRAETESSPISSILTNSVIDSSPRTLNLIQPPPNVAPRISSRPASAAPASNSVANSPNSPHLLSHQHQQQVLQLSKPVQQLQLQQQQQHLQQQQQQRTKPGSSYTDRMSGNSAASKFPQGLAGFPPSLMQSGAAPQPAQWKASTRAANPSSAAALATAPPSASTSVKSQIPLQQQVRSQQPPPHAHQISFGVSPAKVPGQSNQHLATAANNAAVATAASLSSAAAVGSPQNSVSKSSSGSPHSSAIAKSAPPPPSPVLPVLPFQKQQSNKNSSPSSTISPLAATNRNLPSILGNPHIAAPQNLTSKPQSSSQHLQQSPQIPKQHPQQAPPAQLYFSYPYMQSQQPSQSDAAAAASYFQQHHRRPSDQRQNSTPASTGMLSLGPSSSLSLAAATAPDASKTAAAAGNSKNLMPHPNQFAAAISQPGSAANAAHPLMYIHAMQTVPLKPDVSSPAEQKPAAGR